MQHTMGYDMWCCVQAPRADDQCPSVSNKPTKPEAIRERRNSYSGIHHGYTERYHDRLGEQLFENQWIRTPSTRQVVLRCPPKGKALTIAAVQQHRPHELSPSARCGAARDTTGHWL